MPKKKKKEPCPICGKNYRDYLTHIWGVGHKTKTIKYLKKKRKEAARAPRGSSKKSKKRGKYCSECGRKL